MKVRTLKTMAAVLFIACLGISQAALAGPPTPKSLFYERDVKKKQPVVKVSVLYYRFTGKYNGKAKVYAKAKKMPLSVAVKKYYRTGDGVRFEVTYNRTGYLYVIARDPAHKLSVLYPRGDKGERKNKLRAGKAFLFPKKGKISFKPPRGLEYLSFTISNKRLLQKEVKLTGSEGLPAAPPRTVANNSVNNVNVNVNVGNQTVTVSRTNPVNEMDDGALGDLGAAVANKKKIRKKSLVYERDQEADYFKIPNQSLKVRKACIHYLPFFLVHI